MTDIVRQHEYISGRTGLKEGYPLYDVVLGLTTFECDEALNKLNIVHDVGTPYEHKAKWMTINTETPDTDEYIAFCMWRDMRDECQPSCPQVLNQKQVIELIGGNV